MSDPEIEKPSPFHPGEVLLQRSVGVAEQMDQFGRRVIRDHMPDQHRAFFGQLPFVVVAAADKDGAPWITLLSGRPGFMTTPDPRHLALTVAADPSDPVRAAISDGTAVGLLGIELQSRRRNRMNGNAVDVDANGFVVSVEHSFGNCPQYIQLRDFSFVRDPERPADCQSESYDRFLPPRGREIVERADTFFVASYMDDAAGRHVDASHRGGKPGFVRINEDGSLTIPDFAGNLHFNTLGNFLLNPRAGLVFPDFETGDVLHLTGTAEVILQSKEVVAFQGAERLWHFRPDKILLRKNALPLRWSFRQDGWSPNIFLTGNWKQARSTLDAAALKREWRPFRIAAIVQESSLVRSFALEPADGKGVVPHIAGQHLPVRVRTPAAQDLVQRSYTISSAPSDGFYRISIKRQGLVSNHFHDRLSIGDLIEVRAPAGDFTLDAGEQRPVVLVGAGIGITPLLSMLRHLVYEGLRTRGFRPAWLFFAARNAEERAFHKEITQLAEQSGGAIRLHRTLADSTGAAMGKDYDHLGRIDIDLLRSVLPFDGYDFYLCGPPSFTQSLYESLRAVGISDSGIHTEAFGPASIIRSLDDPPPALMLVSSESVAVAFSVSAKEARWSPGGGTLLELAESRGLTPEYSCRSGNCGSCAVRVLSGEVTYTQLPRARIGADQALICCAFPAASQSGQKEALVLEI